MQEKKKQIASTNVPDSTSLEKTTKNINYPQNGIIDIDRRLEKIEKMVEVAQEVAEKAIKSGRIIKNVKQKMSIKGY